MVGDRVKLLQVWVGRFGCHLGLPNWACFEEISLVRAVMSQAGLILFYVSIDAILFELVFGSDFQISNKSLLYQVCWIDVMVSDRYLNSGSWFVVTRTQILAGL